MVKLCFSANEDVWVGYGDEIAKFGCFVFDTLEIDIDDFEGFVTLSLHCCCGLRDQSVVGGRCADVCEENELFIEVGELGRLVVS